MSSEVRISEVAVQYKDSEGSEEILALAAAFTDVTTKKYNRCKHNVGTSEEALKLGEVTSLGWCIFVNRDLTNYVQIRTAADAITNASTFNDAIKVPPGKAVVFHFGSDAQTPYAIANTAACQCEYLIVST